MSRFLAFASVVGVSAVFLTGGCGSDVEAVKDAVRGSLPDAGAYGNTATPGTSTGTPTGTTTGTPGSPTTSGGTTQTGGSCNPQFCPGDGFGEPCCVTPNGPCGNDVGMGCTSAIGADQTDGG